MWEVIAAFAVPVLKLVFQGIAKKKLTDKEFTEYILAHQKKRATAGDSALNWQDALEKAKSEMKNN